MSRLTAAPAAILAAALLVLAAFFVSLYHLERESLWYDEGWSVWTVHDSEAPPRSLSGELQFIRRSLSDTLARVRDSDVHPPLYYVLLDGWVLLFGESVFAMRLLSALLGLPALAATYALGRTLFDRATGLMAILILATTGFFVYYTREARMYALLLSLSALSMWAFWRWLRRPTLARSAVYGLAMALLVYTHYAGLLVIATQAAYAAGAGIAARASRARHASPLQAAMEPRTRHAVSLQRNGDPLKPGNGTSYERNGVRGGRWYWRALPYAGALALFWPWLPIFLAQIRGNPNGPLAFPLTTDWNTVAALWLVLTSANWGLFAAPFVLGRAAPLLREDARIRGAVALLALWLLLTPAALLAANAWIAPVFQLRYIIAVLPAGALLAAYGLRHVGEFELLTRRMGGQRAATLRAAAAVFLLLWVAYTQLAIYGEFWIEKPPWDATVRQVTRARSPLEPVVAGIAPNAVEAYYDRLYGIRQGIALNLTWRDHTPEEVTALVDRLEGAPSIWTALPVNVPQTWDAVAALSAGRTVGYRAGVANMVFYRFDRAPGETVHWTFDFGGLLRYTGGTGHQLYARTGEPFCHDFTFTALTDTGESYSLGVYLTQGYNMVRAQWDGGIGAHPAGETFTVPACLDVPVDAPRGPYHLRAAVYDWQTLARLPLVDADAEDGVSWGDELVLAVVTVDHPPEP